MAKSTEEIIDFLETAKNSYGDDIAKILFPHDDIKWSRLAAKQMSTCALLSQSLLRFLGVSEPELNVPYQQRVGLAVSDIITVARRLNIWETKDELAKFPVVGDIILIGTHGNEHYLNVTGSTNNSLVISIDAGQASQNKVAERNRMMVLFQNNSYLVDPDVPYQMSGAPNGRRVMGLIHGALL